jgi:hypothetical protein
MTGGLCDGWAGKQLIGRSRAQVDQRSFRDQLLLSMGFAVLRDPELPRRSYAACAFMVRSVKEDGLWRRG